MAGRSELIQLIKDQADLIATRNAEGWYNGRPSLLREDRKMLDDLMKLLPFQGDG